MASLTLKNIPEDLLEALRGAAREDRRSLSQEIFHLLDLGLLGRRDSRVARSRSTPDVADTASQLAAWRALAGKWVSDVDERTEARRLMRRRTPGRKVSM
jgi:plasmid stability protein